MTAPPHLDWLTGRPVSRRRVRRVHRRYAALGVSIDPARLAQIAAGAPATEAEWTDIRFAEAAGRMVAEGRVTRRCRVRRRCAHWVVVAVAVVVALAVLLCVGLTFILLAEHRLPY